MKHTFTTLILSLIATYCSASTPHLLGLVTRDSLLQAPYQSWFQPNYDSYSPDAEVISKLKKLKLQNVTIDIFLGTWCGDSKREVPRFLRVADAINLGDSNIRMIAVKSGDEHYKQSPGGETIGKGVYRVATFIIYRDGKEINRITEFPVLTLEHDLLNILSSNTYVPNFPGFYMVDKWLADGTLTHANISVKGLSRQIKPLLNSPSELNACGYVLMAQGKTLEAKQIFSINAYAYYEDANAFLSLAEAQTKLGLHEAALWNLEQAFKLNDDDDFFKLMLNQYYEARKASDLAVANKEAE